MKIRILGPRHQRCLFSILLVSALVLSLFILSALTISATETQAEDHEAVPYGSTSGTVTRPTYAPISYGLRVLAAQDEIVFTGICGNEITLTAKDICRAMNLSELNYITITGLPDTDDGTLYAGSMGASKGQVISAGSISNLSFAATDDSRPCEATVTMSVNGSGYDVTCRFKLISTMNYTPTVSLAPEISLSVETFANLKTSGTLSAYDPEGDEVTYEIVRYASHGRIVLTNRHTGAYTYTPDEGYTGTDAFSYVVRDQYGNYSTSAVVNIMVSEKPTSVTYADIDGEIAAASILRISSLGLMNGTRVGANTYFKPAEAMSRVEFLVTAMHAAGIGEKDIAGLSAPSFADASAIPDTMAGYVSLAVRRGYVTGKEIDGKLCFCPDETITKAEAAVILSNIIGYAKQTTVTAFADTDDMPAWSAKALTSLKSLGIHMPEDGNADARSLMTRADTALWLDRTIRIAAEN